MWVRSGKHCAKLPFCVTARVDMHCFDLLVVINERLDQLNDENLYGTMADNIYHFKKKSLTAMRPYHRRKVAYLTKVPPHWGVDVDNPIYFEEYAFDPNKTFHPHISVELVIDTHVPFAGGTIEFTEF